MYAEIACFGYETKKWEEKIGSYVKQKPTLFRLASVRLDFSVSFFRCTTPLIRLPPIASGISEIPFGSFGGRDRCAVARAEFSIFLFDNARRRAGRPVTGHLDWISNDIQITFNLVSYRWMRARVCVCVKEKKERGREKERKLIETARACMLSTPMFACGSRLVRSRGWDIRILLSTIRFIKTARHLQTEHRLFRSIDGGARKNGSAIQQSCFTGLQTKLSALCCKRYTTSIFFFRGRKEEEEKSYRW